MPPQELSELEALTVPEALKTLEVLTVLELSDQTSSTAQEQGLGRAENPVEPASPHRTTVTLARGTAGLWGAVEAGTRPRARSIPWARGR